MREGRKRKKARELVKQGRLRETGESAPSPGRETQALGNGRRDKTQGLCCSLIMATRTGCLVGMGGCAHTGWADKAGTTPTRNG